MHEFSVASAIVERAVEAADEHGAETVDGLTIAVGRSTHVNDGQLRRCVELVADDTLAAGAAVTMETVEPRGRCDCGWEGEPDTVDDAVAYVPDPTCPACGDRVELTQGRGCRLASIDVPDPTTPTPEVSE